MACKWEDRNPFSILVGKLAGKSTLERPSCRWENNIKQILNSVRRGRLDLSGSGYGKVVCSCEKGNKPSGSIKFMTFLD